MTVLGTHLHQCTSWCCIERLHLPSVNFFWRLFLHVCPFHDGWFTSIPAHTALSVQEFLTQKSITSMPHPPYSPNLARVTFFVFVFLMKKVLKGKYFADVEEVKQKRHKSTKGHQHQWTQKLFWAVEKCLNSCIASNGEYFEGDWSLKHVMLNTQFLNIFYWLCYYSCPNFPPLLHSTQYPLPSHNLPYLSSCPLVMHITSLASPFPIVFLTSHYLFCSY